MLPSPAMSLENLKKIADFEPSALKSIEKAMGDSRTDKELSAARVSFSFPFLLFDFDFLIDLILLHSG